MMINSSKIYKMRVVFHVLKPGWERAQTIRALRQMIVQSGLVFEPSNTKPSWPRFAYGPGLPVGLTAEREYVDVYLRSLMSSDEVREKLQQAGKGQIEVLQVFRVPYRMPSVQQLASVIQYVVHIEENKGLNEQIENRLQLVKLPLVFRASNGMTFSENVKAYVVSAEKISANAWQISLRSIAGKWLNPYLLFAAILGQEVPAEERFVLDGFSIKRKGIYWQDSQGKLHLI